MFNLRNFQKTFMPARLVFYSPGPEAPGEKVPTAAEVEASLQEHFRKLDGAQEIQDEAARAREIERILEEALLKIAGEYKDKVDNAKRAQFLALHSLVNKACDFEPPFNGKPESERERQLMARILQNLDAVYTGISAEGIKTQRRIDQAARLAERLKTEVGAWDFRGVEKLGDKGTQDALGEYQKAVADRNAEYEYYGLDVGTAPDLRTVLRALQGIADSGQGELAQELEEVRDGYNSSYSNLTEYAAHIIDHVGKLNRRIEQKRDKVVAALNAYARRVEREEEGKYGKRRVEGAQLARAIENAKLGILGEKARGESVAAASESAAAEQATYARLIAQRERELAALRPQLAAAEARVKAAERVLFPITSRLGLDPNAPIDYDAVRDALKQADAARINDIRDGADSEFASVREYVDAIYEDLRNKQTEHNRAWDALKPLRTKVRQSTEGLAHMRTEGVEFYKRKGKTAIAEAGGAPREREARTTLASLLKEKQRVRGEAAAAALAPATPETPRKAPKQRENVEKPGYTIAGPKKVADLIAIVRNYYGNIDRTFTRELFTQILGKQIIEAAGGGWFVPRTPNINNLTTAQFPRIFKGKQKKNI